MELRGWVVCCRVWDSRRVTSTNGSAATVRVLPETQPESFMRTALLEFYFFSERMYFTRSRIWSLESLRSKGGILFLPLLMMVKSSSSDCFWTSSDANGRSFRFLPSMESPAPFLPWQAEHFVL